MVIRIFTFIFSCFFLLIRKFSTVQQSNRNNIIIVSLHKIGDTVFTIPAVKYLHNIYNNNLFIICYPDSGKIYKTINNNLKIEVIPKDDFLFSRFALPYARRIVKQLKPKLVYDITGTITSLSLTSAIRTEGLYGITEPVFRKAYTAAITRRKIYPLVNLYLSGVKYLTSTDYDFNYPDIYNKVSDDHNLILVHPFAGWRAKEWNLNKFISLAELLSQDYKCAIVSEMDRIHKDTKDYLSGKEITLIETKNIEDLISEIRKCSLFIGNDSGPLYIAAMLGKATFTIYGPTNPLYSLPSGSGHSFIKKELKCSPDGNIQYCFTNAGREGCPAFECMNLLDVKEVYERIVTTLKGKKLIVEE